MRRILATLAFLAMVFSATAANAPTGRASDDQVTVSGVFLDAPTVKARTGADYPGVTVIDVTVTPQAGKTIDVEYNDFLIRVGSNGDRSQPLTAYEVLGQGGIVMKPGAQETVGITRTDPGWVAASAPTSGSPEASEAAKALKAKMLPTGTVSESVQGLLFFPIAKKKPKDLDLVYSSAKEKLHISFR